MWPNKVADGSLKTKTPGILSDSVDFEQDEIGGPIINSSNTDTDNNGSNQALIEEFPILDELDRLAKVKILTLFFFFDREEFFIIKVVYRYHIPVMLYNTQQKACHPHHFRL